MGLHFEQYDDFILPPSSNRKSGTPSLSWRLHHSISSSYCDCEIRKFFAKLTNYRFQVFSKEVQYVTKQNHLTFVPVGKKAFNDSLVNCDAIICGAGFETPSEALHLNKKMMVLPIKGQYEQKCNAAALENWA